MYTHIEVYIEQILYVSRGIFPILGLSPIVNNNVKLVLFKFHNLILIMFYKCL